MDNPTNELRARLDELGVKWETGEDSHGNEEIWWHSTVFDAWVCATLGEELGSVQLDIPLSITPEQAIAATVGNAREPSDAFIERIERFCTDYAQCLMDSTILVKRNYESMDRRALEQAEVVEDKLIRELAEDIATIGAGTCKDLGGVGADGEAVFHCSECGCMLLVFDKDGANNLCTSFIYDYPRFCPECGKRIIKEESE